MKLKILGCSGGIGNDSHTTAMLLDEDILIDAGTGVGTLTLDALLKIDHVFITHSHLDHIALLPLLVDTVGRLRDKPLIVYALPATLEYIQKYILNWQIWPDFTQIPDANNPYLRFEPIAVGDAVILGARKITPLSACHTVPAVGFQLDSGKASLVFTGDTTVCEALWQELCEIKNLRYLIVESAFSNADCEVAKNSGHFYPAMLAEALNKLQKNIKIYITHIRQGEAETVMREMGTHSIRKAYQLMENQVFEF